MGLLSHTNNLKYLTMKFTSIPENGSSWAKPLIYAIESEQLVDLLRVEIVDIIDSKVLTTLLLYNVTNAEVDIAPYLRTIAESRQVNLSSSDGFYISPWVFRVQLVANGVSSASRFFFRGAYDTLSHTIFSGWMSDATIASNETIRLSAHSSKTLSVSLRESDTNVEIKSIMRKTDGLPMDVVMNVGEIGVSTKSLTLRVVCDSIYTSEFTLRVVTRDSSAYSVVWVNGRGGLECYTFPHSRRLSTHVESHEVETECGAYRRVVGATTRSLLYSAYCTESEMNRILGILLSSQVYLCCNGELLPRRVLTDTIKYDEHGRLRRFMLEIEEKTMEGGLL